MFCIFYHSLIHHYHSVDIVGTSNSSDVIVGTISVGVILAVLIIVIVLILAVYYTKKRKINKEIK